MEEKEGGKKRKSSERKEAAKGNEYGRKLRRVSEWINWKVDNFFE